MLIIDNIQAAFRDLTQRFGYAFSLVLGMRPFDVERIGIAEFQQAGQSHVDERGPNRPELS